MTRKRILFLVRHPPYGSAVAQEILDAILVAGVFEQDVSVLFADDGIYQLLAAQHGGLLGARDVAKALGALPAYDVEQIYVAAEAMRLRHLDASDFVLPVRVLEPQAIADLLSQQHTVVSG
jgi:tRNA 2-thiouridine synthesizing protein C